MGQLGKSFGPLILFLAASSASALGGQGGALFSKSFPDGSKVRLTSSTITEFRSRPRSANPEAAEAEIYSDREWKLVTYSLLLKRPTGNKEETLWREYVDYPVGDRKMNFRIGTLAVNDVLLSGDRAYLLYGEQGLVSVVNSTKNKDDEWLWGRPTELALSTDVYPVVKWVFTPSANPQVLIETMVHDKVHKAIWDLKGERWVKKK